MSKKTVRVLNVFNVITNETIPFELACEINKDKDFDVDYLCIKGVNESVLSNIDNKQKTRIIDCSKGNNIVQSLKELQRIVDDKKYDIIHTHHVGSAAIVHMNKIKARDNNKIYVYTIHNDYSYYKLKHKFFSISPLFFTDILICNSTNTKNSLPFWVRDKKTKVVYNGVNLSNVARYNTKKENIILNAARLVEQKDHFTLLKAFAEINKKISNVKLLICGDGPLREQLEHFAQKLGVDDNVKFLGNVSREKVYELMNKAKVFVMTSKFEGFCNANVEAMAAGTCVVASNAGAMPEVVGDSGILVEPGDYVGFAEAIEKILKDEKLRSHMSQKAIERANLFSLEKAANEYKNLYKNAIEKLNNS